MVCIELSCYLTLFQHIYYHDNHVMVTILDAKVITMRNRVNAVTLKGLFATWVMEVFQVVVAGLLSNVIGNRWNRELSAFLRQTEFLLIPLIQIHTSPPIKRLLLSKN